MQASGHDETQDLATIRVTMIPTITTVTVVITLVLVAYIDCHYYDDESYSGCYYQCWYSLVLLL